MEVNYGTKGEGIVLRTMTFDQYMAMRSRFIDQGWPQERITPLIQQIDDLQFALRRKDTTMAATYEYHEYADLFPMMSEEEADDLRESMRKHGFMDDEPIILHDGKILDGRNRYERALEVKVDPVFRSYDGDDPLGYVIAKNKDRRHLTSSQKAAVAAKLLPLLEEKAKERQGTRSDIREEIPESSKRRARDDAAKAMDTNPRYVQDMKRINEEAPELGKMVEQGKISVPAAVDVLNHAKDLLDDLIANDITVSAVRDIIKDRQAEKSTDNEDAATSIEYPTRCVCCVQMVTKHSWHLRNDAARTVICQGCQSIGWTFDPDTGEPVQSGSVGADDPDGEFVSAVRERLDLEYTSDDDQQRVKVHGPLANTVPKVERKTVIPGDPPKTPKEDEETTNEPAGKFYDEPGARTDEWYTPPEIIAAVRVCFDTDIGLDPASCEEANKVVAAQKVFTQEDNGLEQDWEADTLFLNPPYERGVQQAFVEHACEQFEEKWFKQAVLLIKGDTSTEYYNLLRGFPKCFVGDRVKFWGPEGATNKATFPSVLVGIGVDPAKFAKAFGEFGEVMVPYAPPEAKTDIQVADSIPDDLAGKMYGLLAAKHLNLAYKALKKARTADEGLDGLIWQAATDEDKMLRYVPLSRMMDFIDVVLDDLPALRKHLLNTVPKDERYEANVAQELKATVWRKVNKRLAKPKSVNLLDEQAA